MAPSSLSRALVVAAVAATATASVTAQTVRIGFHAPLTGFAASDGKSALNGAQLAVEQINARGGVSGRKIELVVHDDQAKPDQAVPLANKFLGEKLKVVVSGSYSGPTRAAAGVFQKAGVPYISSYAIHPDITRAGNFVFRTSFMGEVQGKAAAKLIGETLKHKQVSVVAVNNDFGQALTAGFKSASSQFGVTIKSTYNFAMGDRQFGGIVASVKRDAPEALYIPGYFFNGGPLVAQLRAAGVTAPIIGTEGFDTASFVDIAKKAAEGVLVTTSLDRDSKLPSMRRFIDEYETRYKIGADMVAASTHTAINVVAAAMGRAGFDDGAKIRAAIAQTRDFEAATGRISFNRSGEVYKAAQVQVIRDGKFRHHSVIDDPVLLAAPLND
jgi:branched-chain amino acid transport system substrate-binding protein